MPDDDAGSCARNSAHAVMFGNPIACEAKVFGMRRKVSRIGERACNGPAFDNRHQIKKRE
jgi:hypothetical protein